MGGDVRIVNDGQNQGPIIAATVENFGKRRPLIVALVNASGDVYNSGGVQQSSLFHSNENYGSAQSNNQLQAAPGAGLALYITDLIISNGATAGTIKIVEDTTGASGDVLGPYYFAANAGMSKSLKTPRRLTTNKDVGVTSVTVTTHTVTLLGYIAP